MTHWVPEAAERFEHYKSRVRLAVAGNPAVSADDVLQDIQAHVEAELGGAGEPVTVTALERVLAGLGSPSQWDDARETPPATSFRDWVRRTGAEWHTRLAGDWGAPVLLVVVTSVALGTLDTIGIPLLALAYITGRGMLARKSATLAGAPRWLTAAPVVVVSGLLIGVVAMFPLLVLSRGVAFVALGLWWVLLGYAVEREPRRVRAALYPLADWFEAGHGRLLLALGFGLVMLGVLDRLG